MMHLPRLLLSCLLVGIILLLAGPTTVVSAEGEGVATAADLEAIGLTAEEQHLLVLLNAARTEAGVPALAAAHTLVSLAGSRSHARPELRIHMLVASMADRSLL